MVEKIKKNDFIEIGFKGTSNGEIFDTTNPEEAKEIGIEADVKPIIASVGNEMVLKGLDENLEDKEVGKKYSIHLTPDKAFGPRNPQMIKTIPIKVFTEKNLNPQPGMVFQLDQSLVRIISVSGGRVMADFNNPLAGKEVDYEFKINKIISDNKEKINALQDFFFRQRFEFELRDKKVIFKDDKIKPIIDVFNKKFKEMTGLEFEVSEKQDKVEEEKPKEKKQENKVDNSKQQ